MAGLLTPQEARELAELSREAFQYHVRLGALTFTRGADGVRYFRRSEIAEFCARRGTKLGRQGQVAAAVFRAFDDGRSLASIVETFHLPPEEVRRLYRQYSTPIGAHVPNEREEARLAKARARIAEKELEEEAKLESDWAARQGWPREKVG